MATHAPHVPIDLPDWRLAAERRVFRLGAPGRHHHTVDQLLFSGRLILPVDVEGRVWTIPPDAGLWLPAGTAHRVLGQRPRAMRNLYLDTALRTPSLCRPAQLVLPAALVSLIDHLAERPPADPAIGQAMAQVIVHLIATAEHRQGARRWPEDATLRQAAKRLAHAGAGDLRLADLAAGLGCSMRTLERGFVRETGLSPRDWWSLSLVDRALALRAGRQPVEAIAAALGYADAVALNRLFRRWMGVSLAGLDAQEDRN